MKIINWQESGADTKNKILARGTWNDKKDVTSTVANIITRVRAEGDPALLYYTKTYDGVDLNSIVVNCKNIKTTIKEAIDYAYKRIRRFHELQIPQTINCNFGGVEAWKSWFPIDSVGLYVPGGTAPLVSTLLMLAIPAKMAGCNNIVCVTPPDRNGTINPAILYAAQLCDIEQVYSIGGAQAIAALAYGTQTVPKVDKIFGPGNKYVTEAKLQVSKDPFGAALDMPAGPSEVLVIATENVNPQLIAADLLAQAEHDEDAVVICITTSNQLATKINTAVKEQLKSLKRKDIINKSLEHSYIIIAKDLYEAFEISNTYAPEHLILNIEDAENYIKLIRNAGSVFLGQWSAEALGDYASGPSHVLPTYGYAKNYGGLGVENFMKAITFQKVSKEGLLELAPTVEVLANFEGLDAHQMSVSIRRLLLEGDV